MAGLLTHLSIAVIGFLIGTFIFRNYKYGVAFGIGHLIPDLISFGIIGLFIGSTNPSRIMLSPWFRSLAVLGHTWWHWVVFGLLFIAVICLLYKFKKMSKKTFILILLILIFFLAGVGMHIGIDHLIIEKSYWI